MNYWIIIIRKEDNGFLFYHSQSSNEEKFLGTASWLDLLVVLRCQTYVQYLQYVIFCFSFNRVWGLHCSSASQWNGSWRLMYIKQPHLLFVGKLFPCPLMIMTMLNEVKWNLTELTIRFDWGQLLLSVVLLYLHMCQLVELFFLLWQEEGTFLYGACK